MKANRFSLLILIACLGGAASRAAGQTGRIAHLSHGGSLLTLAAEEAAEDNFGLVTSQRFEKVTRINDSVAVVEGHTFYNMAPGPAFKQEIIYHPAKSRDSLPKLLEQLHQQYPKAQFVGFSTLYQHQRRKKAGPAVGLQRAAAPQKADLGLAAGVVVALAGAGWLLGGKARAASA